LGEILMPTQPPHTVIERHFVTVRGRFGTRQVHYRRGGHGPVVLLLHQSPQSSREMEPLIEQWCRTFTLIAPDSPGYGLSQPLQRAGRPVPSATIDDFAAATLEFAAALSVGRFGIYGFHTGASIGVALAHAAPDRVTAVAANGFVVLTEEERTVILRDYLPPLLPRWDGGHLAWLWGRMREQIIFFPWHDRRAATRMKFPMPSAAQLQRGLDEYLAAGDQYHVAYAAAFSDRSERRLPSLKVPLLITAAARDPLSGHLARIGTRSGTVQVVAAAEPSGALEQAFAHLLRYPGDAGPRAAPAASDDRHGDSTDFTDGASEYRGLPGRQIRVIRTAARNAGSERRVILLHAPGSSAESLASLARSLAEHAEVLSPDLPGHGASDPLAAPEHGALAGTALQLSTALAPSSAAAVTTLVAIGSSAPVAIELAAQLGRDTRVVLLCPPTRSAADIEAWLQHGLPAITPVWSGGHLLEAWHLVRDSRLFSPWFRREPAAIRPGEPDLDDVQIHREVRDLLRANGAWQALLRDVLVYRDAGGASPGLGLITLQEAPENWADILIPVHDGKPTTS
jgi:pimeloyl-ACP methyl ester carboxylesterase